MSTRYVFDFSEGDKDQKDLLGGKGANLAEMVKIGLPVPPGFTITTDACRVYLAEGKAPASLADEVTEHVKNIEKAMGRKLGDPYDPLLVSVRSGAKFSMPGMMDTVLNLGLNDESVKGLAHVTGDERFAYDSYRRFIAMYGRIVQGVDGHHFEVPLEAEGFAAQPVYFGGPVQTDRGFVLHRPLGEWHSTLKVTDEIGLTSSRDVLQAIGAGGEPKDVKIERGVECADHHRRTVADHQQLGAMILVNDHDFLAMAMDFSLVANQRPPTEDIDIHRLRIQSDLQQERAELIDVRVLHRGDHHPRRTFGLLKDLDGE